MGNVNPLGEENMSKLVSGAYCLALGATESGVKLVTGYPGSPATAVVNAILELTSPDEVRVQWTSNEKVAVEIAFGASLGGQRALLAVKSVGLNIALDPLMTMNLSGCNAGFVILVGDDPGSWGSQNEQDSRVLATLTEIPWLEPTSASDAYAAMRHAFDLSEEMGLPVVVRITRALALAKTGIETLEVSRKRYGDIAPSVPPPAFQREFLRWVVLPVNVVEYHRRLVQQLDAVQARFEGSAFNKVEGDGRRGIITAGFTHQKLLDLVSGAFPADFRVLRLGTFFPLPSTIIGSFLEDVESVLVLEETSPLVERAVRETAQRAGLTLPVCGRDTGHVSRVGELFAPDLAQAVNRFAPGLALPTDGEQSRSRPSREPLCDGCPYYPTFDALVDAMVQRGGREACIVVGDPGCMVRGQMPPYQLMDVKHGLGSSIGMAAGIATSQTGKQIVALSGDSSFLHSGFNGLVDAAHLGVRMLVVILDNGTTALSGGQPHPGSSVDVRGRTRRAVDLASLARDGGAEMVRVVDLDRGEDIRAPIETAMNFDGIAVVIARGQCVLYS
jgi:indolepyruvate ferredoxin oxidoreductase alpha subunit